MLQILQYLEAKSSYNSIIGSYSVWIPKALKPVIEGGGTPEASLTKVHRRNSVAWLWGLGFRANPGDIGACNMVCSSSYMDRYRYPGMYWGQEL